MPQLIEKNRKTGVKKNPPTTKQGVTAVEVVCAYAVLVVTLLQTLVVPITPRFPDILNVRASTAAWIVTSTLLTGAIATPVLSRLADLAGKRKMLLASMFLVLLGSFIAPFGGIVGIVIGRGLQGIGTAIVPITMALARDLVSPQRLGSALALLSAMLGIGGGLGIPIGGAIAQVAGWQAIFWVAAALSAIAIVATLLVIPADEINSAGHPFDFKGTIVLSLGLTALLIALSNGSTWGWGNAQTIVFSIGGVIVLAIWFRVQWVVEYPLVDVHTAASRPVLMVNLSALLLGFAMFCNLLVTTIQLQNVSAENGFEVSATVAGMAMLPSALVSLLAAPSASRIAEKLSPAFLLGLGAGIIAVGYLLRWALSPNAVMVIVWATILTVGISLSYAALPMIIVQHVDRENTAGANGFNALLRSIGMSLGSSYVATVGVMFAVEHGEHTVPGWRANVAVFVAGAISAVIAVIAASIVEASRKAKLV